MRLQIEDCRLKIGMARILATTINAELAEPAEKKGLCSASSAVSALNVVPCGDVSSSDTLQEKQ